ncbi:MAG: hypothetical protein JNL32_10920 [Candidatus Kapabacteria bacterium]|nr:hypothetical protein [Candidatus Kapabacteria bacterium]
MIKHGLTVLLIAIVFAGCKDNPTTPAPTYEDLPTTARGLLADVPVGTVFNYVSTRTDIDTNGVEKTVGGEIVPTTIITALQKDANGNSYITYSSSEISRRRVVANDTSMWLANDTNRFLTTVLRMPARKGDTSGGVTVIAVNEPMTFLFGTVKVIGVQESYQQSSSPLVMRSKTTYYTKAGFPIAMQLDSTTTSYPSGKRTVSIKRMELQSVPK